MSNPFQQFQTDTIRVISKASGNVSADLKAHVTKDTINLYDLSVDVTEGDIIERDLPNNRTEKYEVLIADYKNAFSVIPAHYILNVRKTTAIIPTSNSNTVYNLHGNNSRVYHNSEDKSNNIVNESSDNLFDLLKDVIQDKISDNRKLLSLLNELEESKGKSGYLEKYTAFISNAANHITLISPFIPALTALIPT
jgi:hypothetical protein